MLHVCSHRVTHVVRTFIGSSLARKCSMSRKKISTTIYVTPEQSERLRLLNERTKVPVAVYIREGIDLVLRQYSHVLPGQLSLTGDAEPSTAAPREQERGEREAGDKPGRAASGTKG
jgi:Ribbon-helix-helix domain